MAGVINSSGPVVAFSAVFTVAGAVVNVTGDATQYPLIFNSELFDIGGGYNPATGVYTAPKTGKYFFGSTCLWTSADVSGGFCSYFFQRNGSIIESTVQQRIPIGTSQNFVPSEASVSLNLTAGDTVNVILQVSNISAAKTTSVQGTYGCQFYGRWIAP